MTKLIVEKLWNEEGAVFMVRGNDRAAILEAARRAAFEEDLVVDCDPGDIQVVGITEVDCNPDGHELLNGGWCDGDYSGHFEPVSTEGEFTGAFVQAHHPTREERKAEQMERGR